MDFQTFTLYFACRGLWGRYTPFTLTISVRDEADAQAVALNMRDVMGWEFIRLEGAQK